MAAEFLVTKERMSLNPVLQRWSNFAYYIAFVAPSYDYNNAAAALPHLKPCSVGGVQSNCSQVCPSPDSLFNTSEPDNLVTCGLWATVCSYYEYNMYGNDSALMAVFSAFDSVGLSLASDYTCGNLSVLVGNIVDCAADFYSNAHSFTNDNGFTSYSCSRRSLFAQAGVGGCLIDLCSLPTLNPDIAGVGVCVRNFYNDL